MFMVDEVIRWCSYFCTLIEILILRKAKSCEKSSQRYTATPTVDVPMIQLIGDYNYDSRLEVEPRVKHKIDGKMKSGE